MDALRLPADIGVVILSFVSTVVIVVPWHRDVTGASQNAGTTPPSRQTKPTGLASLHPGHGRQRVRVQAFLHCEHPAPSTRPNSCRTLDMPGKVADFLRAAELEPAEHAVLDLGVTVRCGQG